MLCSDNCELDVDIFMFDWSLLCINVSNTSDDESYSETAAKWTRVN